MLADTDGKVCQAYGVWQEKSLYGRKFMGIVRSTFVISPQGKIAKIYPKVKVKGHVDEVLGFLMSVVPRAQNALHEGPPPKPPQCF